MILRRKLTGLKAITEAIALNYLRIVQGVGERTVKHRRCTVRSTGGDSSDNVGMSSENYGEKP